MVRVKVEIGSEEKRVGKQTTRLILCERSEDSGATLSDRNFCDKGSVLYQSYPIQ